MASAIWLCERGTRAINQDRAGAFWNGTSGLFFVADGMGGHYAGEKASGIVAQAAERWWKTYCKALPQESAAGRLQDLLLVCDRDIRNLTPPGEICGTTAVVLLVYRNSYTVLSVGDSRCYWMPKGWNLLSAQQLTIDDVVPEGLPGSGKLSRALGAGIYSPMTVCSGIIEGSGLFALCTDGVYKACTPKFLLRWLKYACRTGKLEQAAVRIEREIRKNGAPDNYSLVLVRIKDGQLKECPNGKVGLGW